MNKIRERVLDDRKGFMATGEDQQMPIEQELAMLKGEVLKLKKRLSQSEQFHNKQRDTEKIKMKDENLALQKEVRKYKKDSEKMKKELDASLGTADQLKKELKESKK